MVQIECQAGYATLRRGRHSAAGGLYLLTTITLDCRPIFADWRCASAACACIGDAGIWGASRLLCWVLMPDHWHGLLELRGEDSLAQVMRRIKGCSARAVNLARGRGGTIWMAGFHDRALRREDDVRDVARYVVANPLRAGLVENIACYPYWDAVWLDRQRRD